MIDISESAQAHFHKLIEREGLPGMGVRLSAVDPKLVLRRGYALLGDANGLPITSVRQTQPGQAITAVLADGEVDASVLAARRN